MKTNRKVTVLSRLMSEFGWGHTELVNKLEEARKVKSAAFYAGKKATEDVRAKALKAIESESVVQQLKQYGY